MPHQFGGRVVQHVASPQPRPAQPMPQANYARPVQQQPPQQAEEQITVTIAGREGVNDVVNGIYSSIGEHGGRFAFSAPTAEGPIYLYYDEGSDNWCIGDVIGSQSYYAVSGPAEGKDMAQVWRIWNGEAWETDSKITAEIK